MIDFNNLINQYKSTMRGVDSGATFSVITWSLDFPVGEATKRCSSSERLVVKSVAYGFYLTQEFS